MTASIESAVSSSGSDRRIVVSALGVTQIFAWGSSYYLLAVLAKPIAAETGWPLSWVIGGVSLGLLLAGLVSPLVGRTIERKGGARCSRTSAALLAAGLLALAYSRGLYGYLGAWVMIGLGMGAGLYDPAFSTLGHIYGQSARPLDHCRDAVWRIREHRLLAAPALLEARLGWRGTCVVYAFVQLLFALPIHLWALPRQAPSTMGSANEIVLTDAERSHLSHAWQGSVRAYRNSYHDQLRALDGAVGSSPEPAPSPWHWTFCGVAFGAIIGPSQVGARTVEMFVARFHHPIWTKLHRPRCVALGIALLSTGLPVISAALVLYGAGIGLVIARGTLPLAVFGAADYPAIMGRIARPSLVAQAVAPTIAAGLVEVVGFEGMLAALISIAIANALLSVGLFILLKIRQATHRHELF